MKIHKVLFSLKVQVNLNSIKLLRECILQFTGELRFETIESMYFFAEFIKIIFRNPCKI